MLINVVPETFTVIDVSPNPIKAFSDSSPTSFPISLIDFLGTIPLTLSSAASFNEEVAKASLCASVATLVMDLSSIIKYRPFKKCLQSWFPIAKVVFLMSLFRF